MVVSRRYPRDRTSILRSRSLSSLYEQENVEEDKSGMTTMDDMDMDEYSSDEEDYFSVNELLQKHLCCPSTDSEDSISAIKNDNDLKESMCLDSNNNDTSSYAVIPTDNFVLPEVDDREYILPEDRSPSVDTYDSNDEVNSEEYIHHDDDEYIGNGGHTGGGNRSFSPYISDSELISHSPKKLNQLDQYDGILNHQKLPLIYTTDLQSNDPIQDRLYTAGPSSRLLSTLISSNQSQGNREESRPSGVTNHFHIDDRYIQYIDNEFPYQLYDPTTGRSICDEEVDDFVNRNISRVGKKFVCAFTGHQSRQCTEVPRPRSSVKDHVESILRFRCLVCGPILAGKGNIRYHMQRHGLKRNVIKK